jgi:replicative DNA helicase
VSKLLPVTRPDAERAVLGAMIIDPDAIENVSEFLAVEHFYNEGNRIIYQTMLKLSEQGMATDSVTVIEALRQSGKLEDVGNVPYIIGLMEENPGAYIAEQHAEIVVEAARLRSLQTYATKIQASIASGEASAEVLNLAEQSLANINEDAAQTAALSDDYLTEAESILNDQMGGYVQTGFYNLDRMLGGLKGVVVLAARPSSGKSSISRDIARNIMRSGKKVALLSPDQSGADIYRLEASLKSGISLTHIKGRQYKLYEAEEWQRALHEFKNEAALSLMLDDRPLTLPSLTARFRSAARWGAAAVIIDYMQLVEVPGLKASEEYAAVTAVSKTIKRLTRETGIPALVLAQLNRMSEGRSNPRPIMSDLRSSGQIEQDADSILFIHRPNKEESTPLEPVEFIIAKQKDGPIGVVNLTFKRDFTTFLD